LCIHCSYLNFRQQSSVDNRSDESTNNKNILLAFEQIFSSIADFQVAKELEVNFTKATKVKCFSYIGMEKRRRENFSPTAKLPS